MNQATLIHRDPALASVMGAIGGNDESDFGVEFGEDWDDDFEGDYDEDEEDDMDFDMGVEFAGPGKKMKVSSNEVKKILAKRFASMRRAASRGRILEPNRGSHVKVERYVFTLSETLTLNTAQAFTTLTGQPDTAIRPQRLTCNSPAPGFAFLQEIKLANVSVSVGAGQEDAFNYGANAVDASLDMPTLTPANRATILGNYTGFVPPGYVGGASYTFSASFKGPARIVA